ncbi:Fic family protein [Paraglaciecola sp. MB-3u-78]|uniref:Fic family protein n=1 Tax=Paraglaciecola sp. MB-3u-78 TaxID=2058332 RepID=UPI001E3918CF|nr:Fic family protein [Paraglaciecola sp. MB-3u-78]
MNCDYNFMPLEQLGDIESKAVLKATAKAHQALGELKGLAVTMPNQYLLLATLSLQEAKESSEIENIITTQDDLYRSNYQSQQFLSTSAKEVHNYAQALETGYNTIIKTGLLTNNTIIDIQRIIENNDAGFRTQGGTQLVNQQNAQVVYTPPQTGQHIIELMGDLENFINNDELCDYDELVKMALIHHQFESIHPFYDGNGRTGRIINILYLSKQKLLGAPILYLSRYLNKNKAQYYQLLQGVRDNNDWQAWLLFMLKALQVTSQDTLKTIKGLIALMQSTKQTIKAQLPKMYSHELINNLFIHPYTKVEFITQDLNIHRNTASKYLNQLVDIGVLTKHKLGKDNYYLNTQLYALLSDE